jgi:hypothetical protein
MNRPFGLPHSSPFKELERRVAEVRLPRGWIDGLTLSNNTTDATNDLDIAAGECRGARGILDLVLTSAITKRLDADWAAGTNQGMRYAAAAITNATYHIHLIGKADGTVDVFGTTAPDPTTILPSGYVDYRRIGSILRESGAIAGFSQIGDEFLRSATINERGGASFGTTGAVTQALTGAPNGVKVWAKFMAKITNAALATYTTFSSFDQNDEVPQSARCSLSVNVTNGEPAGMFEIRTNTSRQIRVRTTQATAGHDIFTYGWVDTRGRDA